MKYKKVLNMYDVEMKQIKDKEIRAERLSLYTSIYPYMILGKMKNKGFTEFCDILDGKDIETIGKQKINNISEEDALKLINELEKKNVKREVKTGENF